MPLTRSTTMRMLNYGAAAIVIAIILIYIIWRSLNYARGPHITIFEPTNGSSTASSTLEIKGRVERVNDLTINDHTVSVNEQGEFKDVLVIFPGENIITIFAKDQFDRNTELRIEIIGKGKFPEHKASSTSATSTRTSSSTDHNI